MNWSRRWLPSVALLITAAVPSLAMAQAAPGGGGGGAYMQRINGVLDQLSLTAEEKSKIDDVLTDARQDGMKLRSELTDLSPEERQQKVREFVTSLTKKIDAQLTPEQAKVFDSKMLEGMKSAAGRTPSATPGDASNSGPAGRRAAGNAGGRIEQFKASIDKLDLTEDQKTKVKTLFEDLKPKLAALRDADPQDRREKATAIMTDLRTQLAAILTPDQLQSMRESMQAARDGGNAKPATQPVAQKSLDGPVAGDDAGMQMTAAAKKPAAMMNEDDGPMMAAKTKPAAMTGGDDNGMQMAAGHTPAAKPAAASVKTASAGYAVGDTPADLKLDRLDQPPINLSMYKGCVVALVFGSYSCPMFRDHAEELNKLSQKLGSDAAVLLVYTRESNPSDGWQTDRNKQTRVNVKQTTTPAERTAAALMTREAFHLSVPIVVDDPADTLASAFGTMPNGCVVLNRVGAVAAKFHWFEPVSAKHAIDEAMTNAVVMTSPASAADLR